MHLVSPFAMFTLVPPIITEKFRSFSRGRSVTLMGVGEKGESTLFEKKGKKDPSIRSKTETHFGPVRNLQILSQNLFNHCMVDAPASLRTNDRGFWYANPKDHELLEILDHWAECQLFFRWNLPIFPWKTLVQLDLE